MYLVMKLIALVLLLIFNGSGWCASVSWPTSHPADAVYKQIKWYSDVYDTYTWWENTRIWVDVKPVTSAPFVCGPDAILQNGIQYTGSFYTNADRSFCGDLYLSQIFWVTGSGVELDPLFDTSIIFKSDQIIYLPPASSPQGKLLNVRNQGYENIGKVVSEPEGIDCGSLCANFFSYGETVVLKAIPAEGYELSGWNYAGCFNDSECKVVMNNNAIVGVMWRQKRDTYSMHVSSDGNGVIKSSPEGINCGKSCDASFKKGSEISLKAVPNATYRLKNWDGVCSESKGQTCNVVMDKDVKISAYFESAVPPKTLTVTTKGNGTVYDSLGLIDCGVQCTASYNRGTKVSLTATPDEGWKFKKWSGACSGKRACAVNLKANRKVTAVFVPQ